MTKEGKEKKKGSCLKTILIVIGVIIVIGIIGSIAGGGDSDSAKESKPKDSVENVTKTPKAEESSEAPEPTEFPEPVAEHYEVDLSSGHYIAGKDIPSGTYNLVATAGNGNVSSSNMYQGGINEVMGTPGDEFTQETFNGLILPEGETLSLSGSVILHISSDDALVSKVVSRTVGQEVQTDLAVGNYTAGTDFPAGTYTIVCTGGQGNVSSDNMFDGGLNEVMGSGNDGLSVKQVNNVQLPEGVVLTVSGTNIQLVPVGE